ncbi:hypothetical protein DSO57_1007591 [Entomophthora muscae]|uniref:Uncharacterized protein n=1 Tax=Entomophthora muscae TaxID=34485 RepID=A0ACC2RYE7_9FUNG|nr:hypothetical protein DSO57_1007591 [Entomophthora muscae]
MQDLLKISPAELLSIEGIDGADSTQPSFLLRLIQGSGIKTPPSFQMPAAARSIIGHRFRVGVSKLVTYLTCFPLTPSSLTTFNSMNPWPQGFLSPKSLVSVTLSIWPTPSTPYPSLSAH